MKGELYMNRFTTGMMIGGIIGVGSVMMTQMDNRTKRKMRKNGRKMMNKAGFLVDDVMRMIR